MLVKVLAAAESSPKYLPVWEIHLSSYTTVAWEGITYQIALIVW